MAALPVIADVFRCALNWTAAGGLKAENVIHIKNVSGGPLTSADAFESLQDNITANMWAAVSSAYTITSVTITPLDGTTASTEFATGGGAQWQGGASGDYAPALCALVKVVTAKRGRSYRGRVYCGPVSEAAQTAGIINPASVALMQADWTAFRANALTDTWPFVVASYKHSTAELSTACFVESPAATQRRRQGRLR